MIKTVYTTSLYLLITCLTSVNALNNDAGGTTIMNALTNQCMTYQSLSVGSRVIQKDCKISSKWLQLPPSKYEGGPMMIPGTDLCLSSPPDTTSSNIAEITTCNDQDPLQKFSTVSASKNAIVGYNSNCLSAGDDGSVEVTKIDSELGDKILWTTGI